MHGNANHDAIPFQPRPPCDVDHGLRRLLTDYRWRVRRMDERPHRSKIRAVFNIGAGRISYACRCPPGGGAAVHRGRCDTVLRKTDRAAGKQHQHSVAVVHPDNTVHIQNVTLGPQIGSDWIITSGVNPSERVAKPGQPCRILSVCPGWFRGVSH
jgi:hypothetical protein